MAEALGSLNDFEDNVTRSTLTRERSVLSEYTERLGQYRESLAAGLGISLEELHEMPNPSAPDVPDSAPVSA